MLALEDAIHALPSPAAHLKPLNAQQLHSDWFLNINTPNDLQRARELSGNTTSPISAIFK
jgi:molybdopterin-guanine dinucleotide biosynthesis protein A